MRQQYPPPQRQRILGGWCLIILLLSGCANSQNGMAQQSDSATDQPQHTNALANETSPYLLMHAHNPVDWHAWNEATLALAKKENKPIFLSIGYASCHWCHVMERESFLDPEIAQFLNKHFICIKVDREERPDIDEIYMEALMAYNELSGSGRGGGWPLSMFLLPDGRPFFGGTYFPARKGDRGAAIGFLDILKKIVTLLDNERPLVERDAKLITELTRKRLAGLVPPEGMTIKKEWLTRCEQELMRSFDPVYGGFGFNQHNPNIPKFPEPSNLFFLANRLHLHPNDSDAKRMLVTTCQQMMLGGIHDHIGGGFHRYSVDRYWHIPHYEKMLYDNGQLASVYAQAYVLTGRDDFKEALEGILAFVDRELTSPEGGFYASLDAESEGEEGKFYVWSRDEIKSVLTPDEYQLFAPLYGIDGAPNFEGKFYAPQLSQPLADAAASKQLSPAQLEAKLKPIRKKLFDARSKRTRPLTDTKILTAWNGLMIRGYADAGRILQRKDYIERAARAARFASKHLVAKDGHLYRTYTDGKSSLNAYVIDYATLIDGLLALHRATGDPQWLQQADQLQQKQNELFWDEKRGGYFYTSSDHEALLARSKKPTDGAMPSGNSVSATNLIYLAEQLNKDDYRQKADQTILSVSPILERIPTAAPRLLIGAEKRLHSPNP